MQAHVRRGFTLIEILTVVMILGILAALAVPRILRPVAEARETSAKFQLQNVRAQIEVYRLRHGGVLPPSDGGVEPTTLWEALMATDGGVEPLLSRRPALPEDFAWRWDGARLGLVYSGDDPTLLAEADGW